MNSDEERLETHLRETALMYAMQFDYQGQRSLADVTEAAQTFLQFLQGTLVPIVGGRGQLQQQAAA